jgi:pantetheine-phosphate adenylyltransferase
MPKQPNAVYLGTFDPPTYGHLDVIERASAVFPELVVGIGCARGKTPLFTALERQALLENICSHLKQVSFHCFEGLAVDFAHKIGAKYFVRGLRNASDFVQEMQMATMNKVLDPSMDTFFIPSCQELSHISSSLLVEISALGGATDKLTPLAIGEKIRTKIHTRRR